MSISKRLGQATDSAAQRRAGPFGPAAALLPKGQQLVFVQHDDAIYDALERLEDNNFSQLPVRGPDGGIVGVFTWRSFGQRVAEIGKARGKIKVVELPVSEAMEPAVFVDKNVFIDTATDWSDIDYVIVGSEHDPIGVLTVSDVFGRLNDFAEAFVVLYEIEHDIRDLIEMVATGEKLQQLVEKMSLPDNSRRPNTLTDFTFANYRALICNKHNWDTFECVFNKRREIVDADLLDINDLRNDVFHFRKPITRKVTEKLQRFRRRLQSDIEYYRRSSTSAPVKAK